MWNSDAIDYNPTRVPLPSRMVSEPDLIQVKGVGGARRGRAAEAWGMHCGERIGYTIRILHSSPLQALRLYISPSPPPQALRLYMQLFASILVHQPGRINHAQYYVKLADELA